VRRKRKDDPLFAAVLLELQAGRVKEAYMPGTGPYRFVHGDCATDGEITVNPVHAILDTLIHELLHRLHPDWKETYVRRTTTYLRRRLTDDETQRLYAEYQRTKKGAA
jgi:hypothetical protein